MDLSPTLAPKSNQLNTDDLIAGPRTIKITKVAPSGNEQQPVSICFEGDGGKPYLPCKSMRRVMVAAWGQDGTAYVGRRLTLFRDPEVLYGGIQVGGIRISHMSHISQDLNIALTLSRQKRVPYKVLRLAEESPPTDSHQQRLKATIAAITKLSVNQLPGARARAAELLSRKEISDADHAEILATIDTRAAELGKEGA